MATPKLKATLRETGGRRNSIKLRNEGLVPAVMYGHNKDTKSLKVNEIEMEKLLKRHGHSSTVNLEIDGEVIPTLIKDVQKHILKDNLLHIDFQELSMDEKVRLQASIILHGKDQVETAATIVQQQLIEIDIQCLPGDIIQTITVDVSHLKVGEAITVGDLDIFSSEVVEVLNDPGEIIASLTTAKLHEEETEEEEVSVPIYESEKSILEE